MNESLTINKLHIKESAGFTKSVLPEMEFSPAVNIIYGPNASGKSTTARIIQALLWPRELSNDKLYVEADVTLAQDNCQLKLLGKNRSETPNNIMPDFGDYRQHHRYMLAQHELLAAEEKGDDFVKVIINEAHGNINLAEITAELNYGPNQRSKTGVFEQIKSQLRTAKQRENATTADETILAQLIENISAAQAAAKIVQDIAKLQELREQQNSVIEAQAAFDALPPVLANLLKDDDKSLEKLSQEISSLLKEETQEKANLKGLEEDLAALNVSDANQLQQNINNLRAIISELQQRENELARAKEKATAAQITAERKLANIGGTSPLAADTNLPPETIAKLESLANKTARNLAQLSGLEAQLNWLQSTIAATPEVTIEQISTALEFLRQWQLAPETVEKSSPPLLSALLAGGAVILSIAAAFTQHSPFSWLAALAALAAVITLIFRKQKNVEVATKTYWQNEFQQLPTAVQFSWDKKTVQQEISRLEAEVSNIHYGQNVAIKKRELEPKVAEYQNIAKELKTECNNFFTEYGLILPDYVATGENTLLYFVKELIDWQNSANDLAVTNCEITRINDDLVSAADRANKILAMNQTVNNSLELQNITNGLANILQEYHKLTSELKASKKEVQNLSDRWNEKIHARNTLLTRIQLGDDIEIVKISLAQLLPQLDDYQKKRLLLQNSQAVLKAKEIATDCIADELTALNDDELQSKLQENLHTADQLAKWSTEKGECQQRIEDAKKATDCERLQAELLAEEDKLAKKLLASAQSVTGYELVNMLKRELNSSYMPAVMQRARELFASFTTGRYELRISDDQQHFTAFDLQEAVAQSLDQLSSGTRVQLLMSVRLAFVETNEQRLQLPLLLDEALATSDPVREEAIITTALTLANAGRQLFYFTNKPEEAALWEQRATEKNVDHKRINLPGQSRTINIPRPPAVTIADGINLSHEDYGQELKVPVLSYQAGFDNAHIWYVIEENAQIKNLLEHNISTCGQLGNQGHSPVIDSLIGSIAGKRARFLIELLTRLEPSWQQGHPKPFTPLALEESGVLTSENFRNGITELAAKHAWDAKKIIEELFHNSIKRFMAKQTDRLKDYCMENGYYCEEEALDSIQLHNQLLFDARIAIEHGEVTEDEINRLAKRILY